MLLSHTLIGPGDSTVCTEKGNPSLGQGISSPSCSWRGPEMSKGGDKICQHHWQSPEGKLGSLQCYSVIGGFRGAEGIEGLAIEMVHLHL